MNPLQAQQKQKNKLKDLFLPKEIDLAINLIYTFIRFSGKKKTNTLGLKLAIILSGARDNIVYDEYNRVKFEVDELCNICRINRKQLSYQIKRVIETTYHFVDTNGDVVGTVPIHTYRYTRDNKFIYISVSEEAKRLFTELRKGAYQFTQAITDNLFDLKHKHSLRMQLFLELVNNYNNNFNKKIEMTLEELNGYFGVNYKNMYDIERKILKPVKAEISCSNNLTFDYKFIETISGGRPKIDKVAILVKDNTNLFSLPQQDYEQPAPSLPKEQELTDEQKEIQKLKKIEELEQQIDRELIFLKLGANTTKQKREIYLKIVEFINYVLDNNKTYKDLTQSFLRYYKIGVENGWNF